MSISESYGRIRMKLEGMVIIISPLIYYWHLYIEYPYPCYSIYSLYFYTFSTIVIYVYCFSKGGILLMCTALFTFLVIIFIPISVMVTGAMATLFIMLMSVE